MVLSASSSDDDVMIYEEEEEKPKLTKADYQRKYYEKNKERLAAVRNKKFVCPVCDGRYTKTHSYAHFHTQKHLQAIKHQAVLSNIAPDVVGALCIRLLRQNGQDLNKTLLSIYRPDEAERALLPDQKEEQTCEGQSFPSTDSNGGSDPTGDRVQGV